MKETARCSAKSVTEENHPNNRSMKPTDKEIDQAVNALISLRLEPKKGEINSVPHKAGTGKEVRNGLR